MSSIAIIPARGGSKRIPRKNIKNFLGKPIIAYSIEAALQCGLFDVVMVSTDDKEIADIAEEYGAEVPFLRSRENSNDFAGISEVCIEVISKYWCSDIYFDCACCILPTAPFIERKRLIEAAEMLASGRFDCIFTVVEYSYPIQRSLKMDNGFITMKWPENFYKRSQDLEKTYHDAGQFYLIKRQHSWKRKKCSRANREQLP